jgi:beta-barrel assembly-enhancing protease
VINAARAGYDADDLPSILQLLQAQSASDGGFALLFATHPAPDARIDSLVKAMKGRFDGMASYAGVRRRNASVNSAESNAGARIVLQA